MVIFAAAGLTLGAIVIPWATVAISTVILGSTAVTVWAITSGKKQADRSISESEKQRKLSEKALKFQEGAQETSKSQFTINVVLGILGLLVAIVTLYAMFRTKKVNT